MGRVYAGKHENLSLNPLASSGLRKDMHRQTHLHTYSMSTGGCVQMGAHMHTHSNFGGMHSIIFFSLE